MPKRDASPPLPIGPLLDSLAHAEDASPMVLAENCYLAHADARTLRPRYWLKTAFLAHADARTRRPQNWGGWWGSSAAWIHSFLQSWGFFGRNAKRVNKLYTFSTTELTLARICAHATASFLVVCLHKSLIPELHGSVSARCVLKILALYLHFLSLSPFTSLHLQRIFSSNHYAKLFQPLRKTLPTTKKNASNHYEKRFQPLNETIEDKMS